MSAATRLDVRMEEAEATGEMIQFSAQQLLAWKLAKQTADAYSWDAYGGTRWLAAITMLLKRGYNEREVEAIMRSKWTRWAMDMATDRGRRYGYANSADLARFLDTMPEPQRSREVADLVAGTF